MGYNITFDAAVFAAPRKTITLNGTQLPPIVGDETCTITPPAVGVVIDGDNASRVFQTNLGSNVTLTGLTIRGGNLGSSFGGAGVVGPGVLLLDSCTLTGNTAGFGGAIYTNTDLGGTTVTLRYCTLSGNTATVVGGGLYNAHGLTVLDSCTAAGNTAPAAPGQRRGLRRQRRHAHRTA